MSKKRIREKEESMFIRFGNFIRRIFHKDHQNINKTQSRCSGDRTVDDQSETSLSVLKEKDHACSKQNHANKPDVCASSPSPSQSSNFKNELAAKLNAGPNFGGPRRSASNTASSGVPGSGDSNNLSFSASSPHTPDSSTYVDTSIEKQSSDAYLEHARLRINLNMQRKHRPASKFANNQLSMSMATSDNSFTSPLLDNIAEEDDGNSVSSRPMPISSLNDANVLLRQRNQISKNSATTRASVGEMMHEACSTSSAKENFVRRSGSSLTTTYPAVRPFDSTPKENKSIIRPIGFLSKSLPREIDDDDDENLVHPASRQRSGTSLPHPGAYFHRLLKQEEDVEDESQSRSPLTSISGDGLNSTDEEVMVVDRRPVRNSRPISMFVTGSRISQSDELQGVKQARLARTRLPQQSTPPDENVCSARTTEQHSIYQKKYSAPRNSAENPGVLPTNLTSEPPERAYKVHDLIKAFQRNPN